MRDEIKSEIRRVTAILYSKGGSTKFEELPTFRLFGHKKALLMTCISARVAARLEEPLKRSDVDKAYDEFKASMVHFKDVSMFNRILKLNSEIGVLLWNLATLAILKRRGAHQVDEMSYYGAIYALEKRNRGPISKEQKELVKSGSLEIEVLTRQLEELELEELKKTDPAGHSLYAKELVERRKRLDCDSPEAAEARNDVNELIAEYESQLVALLSGKPTDFFEE